ncbi:MAG: sugar phosphate isomerase/epimerase family protein [bacterium]
MKFAFSTLGDRTWKLEDFAEYLQRYGYNGIEIRGKEEHISPAASKSRRQEVKKLFDDRGVEILSVAGYTRFTEREKHPAMLDEIRRNLELAADLGASFLRTFGGDIPQGMSVGEACEIVAEGLREAVSYAEEFQITIALETHDDFCLSDRVRRIVDLVGSDHLKVLWDVHHPYRFGESPEETAGRFLGKLAYLHVKDSFPLGGGRQLVLLGAGDVPVLEIMRNLRRGGYDGYISVEWEKTWHPELPGCEVAIPQHIFKLREYLKILDRENI